MGLSASSEADDLLELLDDEQLERDKYRVDCSAAGPGGAEVRACVEEHGDVTSADVPDVEAEFCTVYEGDSDGLSRVVSEHPTREAAQRALEDGRGARECQAAVPVSDDLADSSARPALRAPAPCTAEPGGAAARSMGIASNAGGGGR